MKPNCIIVPIIYPSAAFIEVSWLVLSDDAGGGVVALGAAAAEAPEVVVGLVVAGLGDTGNMGVAGASISGALSTPPSGSENNPVTGSTSGADKALFAKNENTKHADDKNIRK